MSTETSSDNCGHSARLGRETEHVCRLTMDRKLARNIDHDKAKDQANVIKDQPERFGLQPGSQK
ncbi:hypothetical protein AAF712_016565, partial [Marasmius tenuissimus]